MTSHEKSVLALTEAFRKGLIGAFKEFGDTRLVPYPEEIQKEADMVLKVEKISPVLRDAARVRLTYKKEGEPPYPEQCPVYMERYSKIGGELYLENPLVRLEDALKVSAKASYLEWFQKNFPKQEN